MAPMPTPRHTKNICGRMEAHRSLLLSLNASYEGRYAFERSRCGNSAVFLTTDANGKQILTYRGVNVDPDPNDPDYQKTMDTLKQLSEESVYLDLGFGLTVNDKTGEIDPSSAFNTNLPWYQCCRIWKTADGTTKIWFSLQVRSPIPFEKNLSIRLNLKSF